MEPRSSSSKTDEDDKDETIMGIQRTIDSLTKCLAVTDKAVHENELEFLQLVNMAKGDSAAETVVRHEDLTKRTDDSATINSTSVDLAVRQRYVPKEEEEFDSD